MGASTPVDDRDADAAAGEAAHAFAAPAHTWSAPIASVVTAIIRAPARRPRRGDVGVLAERIRELAARDLEDRGVLEPLLDPRAVAGGERLHLLVAAGHDDVGRAVDRRPRAVGRSRDSARGAARRPRRGQRRTPIEMVPRRPTSARASNDERTRSVVMMAAAVTQSSQGAAA